MKAILLAGGTGTRLRPMTLAVNKHLLPIYDKPMIFYPLSTLILAGVTEVCIVCNPGDENSFAALLGDGSQFGIDIRYCIQNQPSGIADALMAAETFVAGESFILTLGDNVLFGSGVGRQLFEFGNVGERARLLAYRTTDVSNLGAIQFDEGGQILSIVEKPKDSTSKHAAVGFYGLGSDAFQRAKKLHVSIRGELEITDLLNSYLAEGKLDYTTLQFATAWFDAGTIDSFDQISQFVSVTKRVRGVSIGSPHEAALRVGLIGIEEVVLAAESYGASEYGRYLRELEL